MAAGPANELPARPCLFRHSNWSWRPWVWAAFGRGLGVDSLLRGGLGEPRTKQKLHSQRRVTHGLELTSDMRALPCQGTAQVYSRFTINHYILINFLVHLMHAKRVA